MIYIVNSNNIYAINPLWTLSPGLKVFPVRGLIDIGVSAFSHKFLKHRPKGQPGSFPFHRTNTTDKPIALTILKKVATLGMVIPFSILDI